MNLDPRAISRRLVYGPLLFLVGIAFAFVSYDQAAEIAAEPSRQPLISKEVLELVAEIIVALAGIVGSTWTAVSTFVQKREKFARGDIAKRVQRLEEYRVHDRENVVEKIAQSELRVRNEIHRSQAHTEDFFRKGLEDIKYLIGEQGEASRRRNGVGGTS